MPYPLLKPCAYVRCGELVPSGQRHCQIHKTQASRDYTKLRGNSWQRGYDSAWLRARAVVLKRAKYLCEWCQRDHNRVEPATQVHHLNWKPSDGKASKARTDPKQCVALCASCHSTHDGLGTVNNTGRAQKPRIDYWADFNAMKQREKEKAAAKIDDTNQSEPLTEPS